MNDNFTELYTEKAPLASPTLTGTVTIPIPSLNDSTTKAAPTAYVRRNSLVLGPSKIFPSNNAFVAYPISVTGNGQERLEFLNLGNLIGNTEDRNKVPGGVYRAIGSILMSRNTKWSVADSRWEYVLSTASGYGAAWIEIGGEGVNLMAAPVGTHPYATPTGGINFSVRGTGLRSTTGYTSGYVNQTLSPMAGVYESTASGLAQWNDTGGTQPIFHALAEEAKGSGGSLGEFYRAESHGSSYGGFSFRNSNGTFGTPTNVSSNKITGSVNSVAYGGAYRRTAEINFMSRGTISGSAVGQSILLRTSPDTDANLADRFEATHDGLLKSHTAPFRFNNSALSTIPVYSSFAGFSVANENSTYGQVQHLSTSTGGLTFYGLSTTSTASTAIPLGFIGVLGATSPTAPAILFSGRKNNGSNSITDIAATEILAHIRNNATTHIEILGNGNAGFGVTTPTSRLHTTSLATAYVVKTALYTLTAADHTVEVTSGTHTQTLPTAVGITGRVYVITNSGSGTVTVGTTSSQTFVNVTATPTTLTLAQFDTAIVQSNGANWLRLK